jgi:hypothetical protein
VVTVYVPEYVVGRWWEHLLHNQSALRLKGRLLFTPGVMVTSVPWQLRSSEGSTTGRSRQGPGRRGAGTVVRRPSRVRPGERATPAPAPAYPAGVVRTSSAAAWSSTSARSRTAATASPGPRDASSSSVTRCRASGSAPW